MLIWLWGCLRYGHLGWLVDGVGFAFVVWVCGVVCAVKVFGLVVVLRVDCSGVMCGVFVTDCCYLRFV